MSGTVLVTGAGGLVGAAIFSHLRRHAIPVIAITRNGGVRDQAVGLDLLRDGARLSKLVQCEPTVVVHLAASSPPRYPDTIENADQTTQIDSYVATAARSWGARYVYVSTCGLYDPTSPDWKDEIAPVSARTPYFSAKRKGEEQAIGMGGAVLRLSSPFGPEMMRSLVLPRFIALAKSGHGVTVWGKGAREQDFISVDDIAQAAHALIDRTASGVFNIASGLPISMMQLAQLVIDACSSGNLLLEDRPDPMEGQTARFSISRARSELNWQPSADLRSFIVNYR